ncbi:glutamine ABC transporter permease, partial [Streptococcus pneumoniae]
MKKFANLYLGLVFLVLYLPIFYLIGYAFNPNHSYLSQLDVTYKTPDLMSHFLPPHE